MRGLGVETEWDVRFQPCPSKNLKEIEQIHDTIITWTLFETIKETALQVRWIQFAVQRSKGSSCLQEIIQAFHILELDAGQQVVSPEDEVLTHSSV